MACFLVNFWYFVGMMRLEYEIELHRLLAEQPDNAALKLAIMLRADNASLREHNQWLKEATKRAYDERDKALELRDAVIDKGSWNIALEKAAKVLDDYKWNMKHFVVRKIMRLAQ
jgi:hypothetical protein